MMIIKRVSDVTDRMKLTFISIIWLLFAASENMFPSFIAFSVKIALLKSLSTFVENSWLDTFLCCRHFSPSTVNIPSPSSSFIRLWLCVPWNIYTTVILVTKTTLYYMMLVLPQYCCSQIYKLDKYQDVGFTIILKLELITYWTGCLFNMS